MTVRTLSPLVLATLLLAATPVRAAKLHCPSAGADPNQDHQIALRYHQMGKVFLHAGEPDKAAAAFDCVLNLSDKIPQARLELARAYDALGLYTSARLHYDLALKDNSLAPEHATIRQRLTELAGKPDQRKSPGGTHDVSRPDFGGEDAPNTTEKDAPPAEPVPAEPTIAELRDQLAELSRRVELASRGVPTCPAPRPTLSLTERWWFWTGLVAGVVLTGGGLYAGIRSGALADDWKRDPDRDVHDDLRTMQRLTVVSLTGAVLSLGAVLVTAWVQEPDAPTPPALPREGF